MDFKILSIIFILGFVLVACDKDDPDPEVSCDTTDITYTNTVASIINSGCAVSNCHVDGNETNAFFSLEGYANSKAGADSGRMLGSINQEDGFSAMPRGGDKLDDCIIDQITAWINAGAPE